MVTKKKKISKGKILKKNEKVSKKVKLEKSNKSLSFYEWLHKLGIG